MFKKILDIFGILTLRDSLNLRQENLLLRAENKEYLAAMRKHETVDMNIGDPDTSTREKRKEYVARVAGYHKDLMGPKIISLVNSVREELDKVDNPRELDLMLKGTSNALWLIYDWGESCVSEMVSYQTEKMEEEELEQLKDKIN